MLTALAARAQLDPQTTTRVLELAADVEASPLLRRETADALDALATRTDAIEWIGKRANARALGSRDPLWYLMIALLQLDEADARHRARDLHPEISMATWSDLALWADHFRTRYGFDGITLEILSWAQSYLRGNVVRIGAFQWELHTFDRPFHVFQRSGELRAVASPGARFDSTGRREVTDGLIARGSLGDVIEAHPIECGAVVFDRLEHFDRAHEVVGPATPLLELHIPDDAPLDLVELAQSYDAAVRVLARGVTPVGLFGDAWLLDPQVRALLRSRGIAALQDRCVLLPGRIPEAKTIRRFFGPDATRANIVGVRHASPLQRTLARFLADPDNALFARCGVYVDPAAPSYTS